jgi:hypothetical protein
VLPSENWAGKLKVSFQFLETGGKLGNFDRKFSQENWLGKLAIIQSICLSEISGLSKAFHFHLL